MKLFHQLFIGPHRELKRPTYEVCNELYQKQLKAAAKCPVNGIKPVMIQENEDTFIAPAFVDELPIG